MLTLIASANGSSVITSMRELDPGSIVKILNRHGVRYVIIGGIAAKLHNLPVPATVDIDLTPSRDPENLARLATAFMELEAGLLTVDPAETWFPRHPVDNWARHAASHDCPWSARLGFRSRWHNRRLRRLARRAVHLSIDGHPVLVVTTTTWEALKQASGRAKDLEHLDQYYEGERDRRKTENGQS